MYKNELFKINKSKFENVYEIPKDQVVYAKVISKDEFRITTPSESDPKSNAYYPIFFKPEQKQDFENMADAIGIQGMWYEDDGKMSNVVSYDSEEKASIDANKAAMKGWMPQSTSATEVISI
jgi:hypothetical protein